jgi:hypothetical protein
VRNGTERQPSFAEAELARRGPKIVVDSAANYATSLQPRALCLGRDRRAVWRNVAAPGGTIDRPVEEALWMPDKKTTGSKKSGGKKSSGSKSK